MRHDRTRNEWQLKRWAFAKSDMHFVAISSRQHRDVARSMGGDLLVRALEEIAPALRARLHVLLVGREDEGLRKCLGRGANVGATWGGEVQDPAELARAYRPATCSSSRHGPRLSDRGSPKAWIATRSTPFDGPDRMKQCHRSRNPA